MQIIPSIERLKTYRLDHDLSYQQLANKMRRHGFTIRMRALHRMLSHDLLNKPHDRTLHKIDGFFSYLDRSNGHTPSTEKKTARRRRKAARR